MRADLPVPLASVRDADEGVPLPSLFIGIVTHSRSRYMAEVTSPELLASFEELLANQGVPCSFLVSDRNDADPHVGLVTRRAIIASAWAQARVESDWDAYISGTRRRRLRRLVLGVHRMVDYLRPTGRLGPPRGRTVLTRLLNIELSHLRLMREAVDRHSDWALIIEDDADTSNLAAAISVVSGVLRDRGDQATPRYVSLSKSFDAGPLGVSTLLHPLEGESWPEANVLEAARPITNTVCAVLYRTAFIARLLEELESMGLFPVIPIDWKLNAALMAMHRRGETGPGDCWFVEPAPFIQRSMS